MGGRGEPIDLDAGWARIKRDGTDRLERLLDSGFDRSVLPFKQAETMQLYHLVYTMASQKAPRNYSEQLYARHGDSIRRYLRRVVLPAMRHKRGEHLLADVVSRWELHKIHNRWMFKIFQYLDRYYVEHHNMPTLQEAGLRAFKVEVFDAIKGELTRAVIELINKERAGDVGVDRSLLRKCCELFIAMGGSLAADTSLDVYADEFQAPLLAASREFYASKAAAWMSSDDVPTYLAKVEGVLEGEAARVAAYMHPSTESPLLRAIETVLLAAQQAKLLENESTGLRVMLRDDRREDLARVYRLFDRLEDGLVPVARVLREHFQSIGLNIVKEREAGRLTAAATAAAAAAAGGAGAGAASGGAGAPPAPPPSSGKEDASDPTFVTALLDLHERAKAVVNNEFRGNTMFQKALKDAFEVFVNKETPTLKLSNADMVAGFVDRLLRGGGERMSEEQVEEACERVVQLFAYIADKDVFGDAYRRDLAKRLLNQRTLGSDAERAMITKLKLRCGAQFTSKMEGMLNDLQAAEAAAGEFRSHLAAKRIALPKGIDFSVTVLTTGFWPSFPKVDLRLPEGFQGCADVFAAYYAAKKEHRKLTWVHSQGTATVRGLYGKDGAGRDTVYEFQLTTLQAVALALFNERDRMGLDEVREALGSDLEVVKRVLHSLSCGKYRLLAKTPEGSTIGAGDSFAYNPRFPATCSLRRIRVPMASLEEVSAGKRNIEEDRSLAIEAALVRIMKARKSLTHAQLVTECMAQLHFFKPQAKEIKKRIEHLISRDYLERDDADSNLYRYLA